MDKLKSSCQRVEHDVNESMAALRIGMGFQITGTCGGTV